MNAIRDFMTRSPHAIGHDQSLKLAHERMHQYGIRHLPVLDGGILVGVLSDRDIAAISPQHAAETTVEEAMSTEPYAVPPDTDAELVTAHMVEHKSGCAVVMENKKVVGVFSNFDALSLLNSLLQEFKGTETLSRHVRSAQRLSVPRAVQPAQREPEPAATRADKTARTPRADSAKRASKAARSITTAKSARTAKTASKAARSDAQARSSKTARAKQAKQVNSVNKVSKVGRAAAARKAAGKPRGGKRK